MHHFLNTTFDDINLLRKEKLHPLTRKVLITGIPTTLPRPSRGLGIGYEIGLKDEQSVLLSYCKPNHLFRYGHSLKISRYRSAVPYDHNDR